MAIFKATTNQVLTTLAISVFCMAAAAVFGAYKYSFVSQASPAWNVDLPSSLSMYVPPQNGSAPNCFRHNSKEWLLGPRLGNSAVNFDGVDIVAHMILPKLPLLMHMNASHPLLQTTLCDSRSRFVRADGSFSAEDKKTLATNQTIRDWSLRLIFFATHLHQHKYAKMEASERSAQHFAETCHEQMQSMGIGRFDFECPEAKFLVISIGRLGLGAVMRLGVVNGLIAGISTDRVVLFVNSSPVGHRFIRQPWLLASCPRRDMQCFYMPPSPCVLTHTDLQGASMLERAQSRKLFKMGELPDSLKNDRVLLLDIVLRPQRTPETLFPRLQSIINDMLIEPLSLARPHDSRLPLLRRAMEEVAHQEEPTERYAYFASTSKVHHALLFYAMRPSFDSAKQISNLLRSILPIDLDVQNTIGLPIRASDKCIKESECLPFGKYMELVKEVTNHSSSAQISLKKNVIITSESAKVAVDQQAFSLQNDSSNFFHPFTYNFINNKFDNQQGSGNPMLMTKSGINASMDEIMLSAISSLKLQFYAQHTLGNCCSNFHLLLFDFLRDGCGASRNQVSECLQDNSNPEYRLCCEWSKTDECKAKRLQKD